MIESFFSNDIPKLWKYWREILESTIKIRDLVVSIEMISSTMPDNHEIGESLRGVELEYAKQIQIGNWGFSDCRFGTIHFLEKMEVF